MRTTRFSALPYWLGPRTMPMLSAPSVRRVGERAEQQRYVVVLLRPGHPEGHGHLRVEGVREVAAGVEDQPVGARVEPVGEPADPAVGIGRVSMDRGSVGALQPHGDA